jgi:hypothetical protein
MISIESIEPGYKESPLPTNDRRGARSIGAALADAARISNLSCIFAGQE